MGQII